MTGRGFIVFLPITLFGCTYQPPIPVKQSLMAPPSAELLYSEQVAYKGSHDPADIYLSDGRVLGVVYGEPSWNDVERWKPGRKLSYAYYADAGAVLVDNETREQLSVISGFGDGHPLDVLLARNLALTRTTLDIVESYRASATRWERETERLYNLYLSSSALSSEVKNDLRAERSAWERFRDLHTKATGDLYSLPIGTMWEIKAAEHRHALIRSQAMRLQELTGGVMDEGGRSTPHSAKAP